MPPGFFDRFAVRRLKRRALQILRDDLPSSDTFVLEDPRFCRLVPFWSAVLEAFGATPHWILVLRHPLEAERQTRGAARTIVLFDDPLRE